MVRHKSAPPHLIQSSRRIKAPPGLPCRPMAWRAAARGEVLGSFFLPCLHLRGLAPHTRSSAPCSPLRPRSMHETRIGRGPSLPCAVCVLIAFWSPSPHGSGSVALHTARWSMCVDCFARSAVLPPIHGGCGRLRYAGRCRSLVRTRSSAPVPPLRPCANARSAH